MTVDEFKALKDGDKVTFNGNESDYYGIYSGSVLTRKESWLDDDNSLAFSYNGTHGDTFHFFTIDDIQE